MASKRDLTEAEEAVWLENQRLTVLDYLNKQPIKHGGVASDSDWFLSPYLSIWRINSGVRPTKVGWWAIAGDCPTDYLSGDDAIDARGAMRAFAALWNEAAQLMKQGKEHPTFRVGTPESRVELGELGELLLNRARLLTDFSNDDGLWSE